jgi:uridine kinase
MRTKKVTTIEPHKIILVEGILIFTDPLLVQEMDVKVFVDADADRRFIRRLQRDISERGRTAEQVIEQYLTTVKPMHETFVEPSKKVADLVIKSDEGNDPEVSLRIIVNYLKVVAGIEV